MTEGDNGVDSGHLTAFIERIEKLEDEKKILSEDVREVFSEAKGMGFDVKIMRKILAIRRKSKAEREEEQAMIELYGNALGLWD